MMSWYERETHSYSDDGFAVDGRIVEVLSHSPGAQRVTVLVEKEDPRVFTEAGEIASEGATFSEDNDEEQHNWAYEEAAEAEDDGTPRITTYFCNEEKSSGGQCTREVEELGDHCWQHQEDAL